LPSIKIREAGLSSRERFSHVARSVMTTFQGFDVVNSKHF
jgi:hypothetical protein